MEPTALAAYAEICGWTLAHAHARSGDAVAIAAYLGSGDAFDRALATFAEAYADQNERDYAAFSDADRLRKDRGRDGSVSAIATVSRRSGTARTVDDGRHTVCDDWQTLRLWRGGRRAAALASRYTAVARSLAVRRALLCAPRHGEPTAHGGAVSP